jgi:hypothetical protein
MAKSTAKKTTETPRRQQMQRIRYEFVLEAALPVAHHEGTFGNEAVIMRRKVRQRDGWAKVPIVTGDTMRHGIREAAAYALLDAAGMLESPSLSEAALRLLFAGGMVTGGTGGSISLDAYRELCELVPTMALMGGCAQNRVVPGRLVVEDATLLCEETRDYVPAWAVAYAEERYGSLDGARAHVESEQRVRMDPTLVPQKRLLLTDGDQAKVTQRLLSSETASAADDDLAKLETKSSMLPRRFERVAQGSLFFWACEATCYTDLDVDTLNVACSAFLANARVGGKRGTGHGLLRALVGNAAQLARPSESFAAIDPTALAPGMGATFRAHIAERSPRIRDFLATVAA